MGARAVSGLRLERRGKSGAPSGAKEDARPWRPAAVCQEKSREKEADEKDLDVGIWNCLGGSARQTHSKRLRRAQSHPSTAPAFRAAPALGRAQQRGARFRGARRGDQQGSVRNGGPGTKGGSRGTRWGSENLPPQTEPDGGRRRGEQRCRRHRSKWQVQTPRRPAKLRERHPS